MSKAEYLLLSDSKMQAAISMGLAFKLDDETVTVLKGYGIDLEDAMGEKHHLLPVPAVFLLDKQGTIQFEYVNPDYKVRVSPEVILAAAKSLG